jgi:hypothetical protein
MRVSLNRVPLAARLSSRLADRTLTVLHLLHINFEVLHFTNTNPDR